MKPESEEITIRRFRKKDRNGKEQEFFTVTGRAILPKGHELLKTEEEALSKDIKETLPMPPLRDYDSTEAWLDAKNEVAIARAKVMRARTEKRNNARAALVNACCDEIKKGRIEHLKRDEGRCQIDINRNPKIRSIQWKECYMEDPEDKIKE